ncbi:MAG: hypothetical protein ACIAS6_06105 [Phycisphaerales bacterium JB060]
MNGTNLLPRHRAHARRVGRCISLWSGTLSSLAMLVAAGLLAAALTRAQPPATPAGLTQRAESLEAELAGTRSQIDALEHQRAAQQRAADSLRWDPLLDIIRNVTGTHIRLRSIHLQPRPGANATWALAISGDTQTKDAPASLASNLDQTGLFESVRHAVSPARSSGDRLEFSIDCVIAPNIQVGGNP